MFVEVLSPEAVRVIVDKEIVDIPDLQRTAVRPLKTPGSLSQLNCFRLHAAGAKHPCNSERPCRPQKNTGSSVCVFVCVLCCFACVWAGVRDVGWDGWDACTCVRRNVFMS